MLERKGRQTTSQGPARWRPGVAGNSPCAACDVRELAICGALEPAEQNRLAGIMTTVEVGPEHAVFYEGDPADYLFNITGGTVRLHKLLPDGRRQITGFLFAGDFLGLAVDNVYVYGAEAVDSARLCRFPRHKLLALMQEIPGLEKRLLGVALTELIQAQDQMVLLGRKTAEEKLATFLLMISDRAAKRGRPSSPVDLPMGRTDIADFLGLTTETVSRTFTQLKNLGVIRLLDDGRVEFKDRPALATLSEGN